MKKVKGKSSTEIAKEIAPLLGKPVDYVRVYVHRWLHSKKVPSYKSFEAIKKAGYEIEPFIFGVEHDE